jgi:Coenzyme PQQ synthesis protein D (PqqD)
MDTYEVPDHVAFEVLDGEAVVLDLESGIYYSFNPVATRVLQLLAEDLDVEQVRATLLEEFDVDEETVAADVAFCVTNLVGRHLLRVVGAGDAAP